MIEQSTVNVDIRNTTLSFGRQAFLPAVGLTGEVQVEDDAVAGSAARRDSRKAVDPHPR